jgi:hypothetical protein
MRARAQVAFEHATLRYAIRPQHFLYFLPLPHGQDALGLTLKAR